jgi:hypothetical protein
MSPECHEDVCPFLGPCQLLREAYIVLCKGVELMPVVLLGHWQGVRACIEDIGDYLNIEEEIK